MPFGMTMLEKAVNQVFGTMSASSRKIVVRCRNCRTKMRVPTTMSKIVCVSCGTRMAWKVNEREPVVKNAGSLREFLGSDAYPDEQEQRHDPEPETLSDPKVQTPVRNPKYPTPIPPGHHLRPGVEVSTKEWVAYQPPDDGNPSWSASEEEREYKEFPSQPSPKSKPKTKTHPEMRTTAPSTTAQPSHSHSNQSASKNPSQDWGHLWWIPWAGALVVIMVVLMFVTLFWREAAVLGLILTLILALALVLAVLWKVFELPLPSKRDRDHDHNR